MIGAAEILASSSGTPPRPPGDSECGDMAASPGLGRLKILVVEDESVIAWALQSLLEDLGHEVVDVVSSGPAAVAAAAELRPELIMMDINLGRGIDGIEAAGQICSRGSVTVIFVSAYGDDATMARAQEAVPGALLVTKPVSAEAIRRAIASTFSQH